MSYDTTGNMISKTQGTTSWTYAWDSENRMKSASSGATSVAYAYDALGRRVKRTQGTQITKFTYDGLDVVMDDVNGTLTKYQNGPGIDNKLKLVTGTTSKYFLTDHLGSTNALTSSTGTILEQTSYDSFGNASNATFSSRYQFTGREYDSLTGLYFYRARWYDANIGRFISEDPIGFRGGKNWFEYVGNNPMMRLDPTGQDYLIFQNGKLTWVYESQEPGIDAGGYFGINNPIEIGRKSWDANTGCDESCPGANKYFPIPKGTYSTAPEDKTYHPGGETGWGPFSYRLHEGLITRLFNRWNKRDGGFHIHGGYFVGTAGCIEFADYNPEQKWLGEFDHEMQKYGKTITLYVY